jgi:PadR family transcriptional regulator, regulatory protein PadR
MPKPIKLTFATGMVLQAIARGHSYGFEIMDASGLPDGTVYPALRRLEQAGLLASSWEDQEAAHAERRPARRHYRLTADGRKALATALERFPGLHAVLVPTRVREREA